MSRQLRAQISDQTVSADGNSYSTSSYSLDLKKPTKDQLEWAAVGLPEETLDMGFRKFKCRKHVAKSDGLQITTWVSLEYHPLVVKQLTIAGSSTEIRKLTWFDAAEIDPFQLYRKVGRSWTLRTVSGAGATKAESSMEYKVKEVREDGATFTLSVLDGKGNSMFSQDTEMRFDATSTSVGGGRPADMDMETKTCAAGEFQCYHTNAGGFETWSSVQWPGLTVATKMKGYNMELVKFDLGHDRHAFFRKQGNYYVTSDTHTTGGKELPGNTTRVEVTEVSETEASYKVTVTDASGKQVSREDLKHAFPEAEEETPVYAGEVEQTVETPAGSYPALYTVAEDGTESWSWNGIVILAKSQGAGTDAAGPHTIELTELKME